MLRPLPHPVRVAKTAAVAALALGLPLATADAASWKYRDRDEAPQSNLGGRPVMAVVSIRDQRVSLYDAQGGVMRSRVSSGRVGYETPVGIYSVLEKEQEHYSNVYDDASMPFMQRITWSGVALHAGVLPGYPASHGCVRMSEGFADQIFPLTRVGMRVVIAYDDVAPVEISHPFLLKPTPPAVESAVAIPMSYQSDDSDNEGPFTPDLHRWPARQAEFEALKSIASGKQIEAQSAIAQADEMKRTVAPKIALRDRAAKQLRVAELAKKAAEAEVAKADTGMQAAKSPASIKMWENMKTKAATGATAAGAKFDAAAAKLKAAEDELALVKKQAEPVEAAKVLAVTAANDAKRKAQPVSIFISLKTKRAYVRQGYEPVFDAPVTIANPDTPIGTHVFTAIDYTNEGKDLRWTAVTFEHHEQNYASNADRRRTDVATEPLPSDAAKAAAALDRITLPPEVMERVSGAVWPGSSIIVSDEEASKETGRATDFIVLVSTEPQGGIKKRPRPPRDYFDRDSADDFYYGYDRYGRQRRYPVQKPFFGWW